ncbi:phosphatase 2C-like domain-containing protein [Sporodiniella umbellata]|nr:phosphatase 2C-like domain-containing protein [Sporodiniella umbellata]
MSESPAVDTELSQLNIPDDLRGNSSFMKVMTTLFHYGNQSMNATQLVIAIRALNLLALRGETPRSTIQGIISTSRKLARDLKISDPFRIDRDGTGRQTKYAISEEIMNGVEPPIIDIPDEPIVLRPVEHPCPGTKRTRKPPTLYYNSSKQRNKKRTKKVRRSFEDDQNSDVEIDADEDFDGFVIEGNGGLEEEASAAPAVVEEEDTIFDYSLLYSPPTSDMDYIDKINFNEYPIAAHFAIVQQKGYSYPRFRSHEKIKIPKVNCEDKFRVTDIGKDGVVVGRLFVLADGHGGPGCSEYFVRHIPAAVEKLCQQYDPETLLETAVQIKMQCDIKQVIQTLDEQYLKIKLEELTKNEGDNDGCTLIFNIFFGEWLINVNVGDSRSILISAPEPQAGKPDLVESGGLLGADVDYKMDVVFASQDHKPYLEHLAREILENGGEFIDSVQNRLIKVDVDKLKEDGNRHAKRLALKNARIRPKAPHPVGTDAVSIATAEHATEESFGQEEQDALNGWAAQSAVRTTATQSLLASPPVKNRRVPSLNVARSCGDLDFKMDPQHKIISCEPDVTFIRIKDQPFGEHTLLLNGPHKEKRRHFLFMSTDGTFDYMYEETAERQNRAIAKVIGPMIEDGEKIGKYLLIEEERVKGATIEHNKPADLMEEPEAISDNPQAPALKASSEDTGLEIKTECSETVIPDTALEQTLDDTVMEEESKQTKDSKKARKENEPQVYIESMEEDIRIQTEEIKSEDVTENQETVVEKEPLPRIPLLYRELTEEESQARKVKERTLVHSARYFANREGAQGFFASTLQDYDDCTIVLVEI